MAETDELAIIDDSQTIAQEAPLTEEQKKRLEEFIEEEEGALNRYKRHACGPHDRACGRDVALPLVRRGAASCPRTSCGRCTSRFALGARRSCCSPLASASATGLMWWDVIFALVSVAIIGYILYWGDELGDRATAPTLDRPGVRRRAHRC